jgi:DNA polymerase III epsilon subunit family exonuclease
MNNVTTLAAELPLNLISESSVVADVAAWLRARGGRAHAPEVADFVLETTADFPPQIAASFIQELVTGDARFRLTDDHHLELAVADDEARILAETDFVVVDVETTGAKTPECRITEIGAFRIRRNRIVGEFASLVNPDAWIPPFISALTGITNEMVQSAPRFNEIADEWLRFAHGAVLVAHNASFDIRFLNCEIARIYPARRMANPHLCTVALSRRILPSLASHRLDAVADHFDISITDRHRATGDALATAHIFMRMLDLLHAHDVHVLAAARKFKR